MFDFFFSYSRKDTDLTRRVRGKLMQAGFTIFIDAEDIDAGKEWADYISQAIDVSIGMLVLATEEGLKSPFVTYEWVTAKERDKTIVPLVFDTAVYSISHPLFIIQAHEIENEDDGSTWKKLIDQLDRIKQEGEIHPQVIEASKMLSSPDPFVREHAQNYLVNFNHPSAKKQLVASLDNPQFDVRLEAALALNRLESSSDKVIDIYYEALRKISSNSMSDFDMLIVSNLSKASTGKAVGCSLKLINDSRTPSMLQTSLTSALCNMTHPKAQYQCVELLKHPNPRVVKEAAWQLAKQNRSETVPEIIVALRNCDFKSGVVSSIIEALSQLDVSSAVQATLEKLNGLKHINESKAELHHAATIIRALGKMEDKAGVQPLLELRKDQRFAELDDEIKKALEDAQRKS